MSKIAIPTIEDSRPKIEVEGTVTYAAPIDDTAIGVDVDNAHMPDTQVHFRSHWNVSVGMYVRVTGHIKDVYIKALEEGAVILIEPTSLKVRIDP